LESDYLLQSCTSEVTMKKFEAITAEFFKRRFPDKDIRFEIECGYFGAWVKRFEDGSPKSYMDEESLKVWKEMQGN